MKPQFTKSTPLLPAIIQDARTLEILMVGYMNKAAFARTRKIKRVTLFSRSKNRLWTKGETSGNRLSLVSIHLDCDGDAILVKAIPAGPTCHKGTRSCFDTEWNQNFLFDLESIIDSRWRRHDTDSYVHRLRKSGIHKTAQKVIEEAGEAALAAVNGTRSDVISEMADLIFHTFVALKHRGLTVSDIARELETRHNWTKRPKSRGRR